MDAMHCRPRAGALSSWIADVAVCSTGCDVWEGVNSGRGRPVQASLAAGCRHADEQGGYVNGARKKGRCRRSGKLATGVRLVQLHGRENDKQCSACLEEGLRRHRWRAVWRHMCTKAGPPHIMNPMAGWRP